MGTIPVDAGDNITWQGHMKYHDKTTREQGSEIAALNTHEKRIHGYTHGTHQIEGGSLDVP